MRHNGRKWQNLMVCYWSIIADIRHFCACGSFVRCGGLGALDGLAGGAKWAKNAHFDCQKAVLSNGGAKWNTAWKISPKQGNSPMKAISAKDLKFYFERGRG